MRKERLVDQAYGHVKQMLLNGLVRAGERFSIDEIANSLTMSRQPVMDAMKRLALEGFVEIVPQVGCRVRSSRDEEIDDFFRLFAAGEGQIAELAAARAERDDVLKLKLISAQIGALSSLDNDVKVRGTAYRHLNRQFHAEMRRIARSPVVASIVESLGDRSDFYIAQSEQPVFGRYVSVAHAEHETIIAAIAEGDAAAARAACIGHIFAAESRLLTNPARARKI
jgi:DNA-binding GntR family transcriptional regulator